MQYENPYGTTGTNVPYVNGNPASGIEGSIIPAPAVQNPMTEVVNAIAAAGLTPTDADLTQLSQAVGYWAGTFGGSANTLTATTTPVPGSIGANFKISGLISTPNTGATTLNVNGLGAIAIHQVGGEPLTGGELIAGGVAEFIYSGSVFVLISMLPLSFLTGLHGEQVFTSSGTFTVPSRVTSVVTEVWGAGGGSGYSTGGGNCCGSSGGGGGYSRRVITGLTPGSTIVVTVGAAGAAGAYAGPTNGGSGGSSSFGGYCSATGGGGGVGNGGNGGTSGSGIGGDLNLFGGTGGSYWVQGGSVNGVVTACAGGTAPGNAMQQPAAAAGSGTPGTNYGDGARGPVTQTGGNFNGATGAGGLVIVGW